MKPANELTREEIASALAEAQGWTVELVLADYGMTTEKHYKAALQLPTDTMGKISSYKPYTNDSQYCALILNPEIHAGMMDVLDLWFVWDSDNKENVDNYWENTKYQANIRLWQLRACVEFLRRQKNA